MIATAMVTQADGKFVVSFGAHNACGGRKYAEFIDAYLDACQYVAWDYHSINVLIHPDPILRAMLKVQGDHADSVSKGEKERRRRLFEELRREFEPEH